MPALRKEITDWLKALGTAVIIVLLLHFFVFNLSTVRGHSMEPTLQSKEWLFINKIGYILGAPKRGDIVILRDPSASKDDPKLLVKRIVAVSGDKLEIVNKRLFVNGKAVQEAYTNAAVEDWDYGPESVVDGWVFVMGDNRLRGASKDSRMFGQVAEKMILGKVEFVLFPFSHIREL